MADLSILLEDVASWILSPLPMDLEELLTALPLLKPLVTWRGPCEELMEQERDSVFFMGGSATTGCTGACWESGNVSPRQWRHAYHRW